MWKFLKYFLFLYCFTLLTSVPAQYNPNNLSVYKEMEGTNINDVLADRMGNIWMATQNGLVRFDGYEYTRYYPDPNDSTTMGSILTIRLYEDRNGNIWISCVDLLSVYNPHSKSFKNYTYIGLTDFPLYSQTGILCISEDMKGRIYFGITSFIGTVSSQALIYYDEKENQLKHFESADGIEIKNIFSSASDNRGNIWFVCQNGVFYLDTNRILRKVNLPFTIIPSEQISAVLTKYHPDGRIWITSDNAILYSWNPQTNDYKSYLIKPILKQGTENYLVSGMSIDHSGNIWLSTNQGLIYFNKKSEEIKLFLDNQVEVPGVGPIKCLAFDSFENLWMGTLSYGLLRYSEKVAIKSFIYNKNIKNSITPSWAFKIIELLNGKIFIATSGNNEISGINLFDPGTRSITARTYRSIKPDLIFDNVAGFL